VDVSGGGEFAAIERIRRRLPPPPPGELWIGDDAAILGPVGSRVLFAADAVVEGVHADLSLVTLADFGWKAVAVNVSDIAAMGGRPTAAVITIAGPPATDLDTLYGGIAEAAAAWEVAIVGGDLTTARELLVSVAILGDGSGDPPPVTRSGASAGDDIWVTGPLGASSAGLRRLRAGQPDDARAYGRPMARLAEGRAAREAGVTAMIDASDGLTIDLGRLLDAAGIGAALDEVPIAPGATAEEALGGGEDYELIFTAPPAAAGAVSEGVGRAGRLPIRIGRCVSGPAAIVLAGRELPRRGWEHPWG
jgi:thiamine-monophosphate kinase